MRWMSYQVNGVGNGCTTILVRSGCGLVQYCQCRRSRTGGRPGILGCHHVLSNTGSRESTPTSDCACCSQCRQVRVTVSLYPDKLVAIVAPGSQWKFTSTRGTNMVVWNRAQLPN